MNREELAATIVREGKAYAYGNPDDTLTITMRLGRFKLISEAPGVPIWLANVKTFSVKIIRSEEVHNAFEQLRLKVKWEERVSYPYTIPLFWPVPFQFIVFEGDVIWLRHRKVEYRPSVSVSLTDYTGLGWLSKHIGISQEFLPGNIHIWNRGPSFKTYPATRERVRRLMSVLGEGKLEGWRSGSSHDEDLVISRAYTWRQEGYLKI